MGVVVGALVFIGCFPSIYYVQGNSLIFGAMVGH
jgi:hypothetical protein